MNNIFNVRVRRLIKEGLLDYGIHLAWFIGFAILIPLILHILFGMGGTINIDLGNLGEINIERIFNFASFGIIVLIMFIAGIEAGYELPQYVRVGIARKEYFLATTTTAVIVSLLAAPMILLLTLISNLLVGSEILLYHPLEISILATQFLMYIALFLLGFCGTVLWQKVEWYIAVGITVAFFIITSFVGWNLAFVFNIFTFRSDDDFLGIEIAISNGLLTAIAMTMIVIFGLATYALIKNTPVKVK